MGDISEVRFVPYSVFNLSTGDFTGRQSKKLFTQTGEDIGWVPKPDLLTWLILFSTVLLWGLGLIPIIYIMRKTMKEIGLEEKCLALQEKIGQKHIEFLRRLIEEKISGAPLLVKEQVAA